MAEPGKLVVAGGENVLEFVWLDDAVLPTVNLLDEAGEMSADSKAGIALVVLLLLLAVQLGVGVEVEEVLHEAGAGQKTLEATVHIAGVSEVPEPTDRGDGGLVSHVS